MLSKNYLKNKNYKLHTFPLLLIKKKEEEKNPEKKDRRGCDCMVVEFITTCAITAYHH